ncbi:COMM domain-containing protein 10-like [Rhopilema esculentum]|uniref:COMM domain-containing protein 10-like n=1 Tax=Rhopilema esculentum TaxID=499914 RepID=UPI0031E24E57
MAAQQTKWFVATANLKRAIQLVNDLDISRFGKLLQRILQKIHLRDERSFTDEEEEKLQAAFQLSPDEIGAVLDTLSFILEQAAYHSAKPAILQQQLESIELNAEKVNAFVDLWTENGASVITKLRKRSLAPKQLDTINWRLNLQLAQKTRTKMKLANAFVELGLKSSSSEDEKIRLEFTHGELFEFFQKLETIQSQLDTLTS